MIVITSLTRISQIPLADDSPPRFPLGPAARTGVVVCDAEVLLLLRCFAHTLLPVAPNAIFVQRMTAPVFVRGVFRWRCCLADAIATSRLAHRVGTRAYANL